MIPQLRAFVQSVAIHGGGIRLSCKVRRTASISFVHGSEGRRLAFSRCLRYNRQGWEEEETQQGHHGLSAVAVRGFINPSECILHLLSKRD
jgi:hypothetical protein